MEDTELLCFSRHKSENGCKYVCIGLEFFFMLSAAWWYGRYGVMSLMQTQLCIILPVFNQRRRGYVLIGEGKSQEIEGEERLT